MKKRNILFYVFVVLLLNVQAQRIRSIYGYWGWNRAFYSKSDIRFWGDNYDITIQDVKAKDRPSKYSSNTYLREITLPQTDARIGVALDNGWDFSLGLDHMKYVMIQDQVANIDGYIKTNGAYDGTYSNKETVLKYSFLSFEHTDGLNYINAEVRKRFLLKNLSRNNFNWVSFEGLLGAGGGVLLPKTNARLWHKTRNDDFHVAGYGLSLVGGIRANLAKYLFLFTDVKGGFIHMPDIRTSPDVSDKASQHFFFFEWDFGLGFNIYVPKKKVKEEK